jgi:histidinol-phosphatase (PHP family)
MINADYHVHTNFSSDGKASMEQMIEQAITLGLQKICFTDHMDYDYPAMQGGRDFVFDMEEYTKKIAEMKKRYRGRIEIRTGVELGLQPHLKERLNSLLQSHTFDFVIGSSHLVDHMDPYYPTYWEGKTNQEGIHRYYESIIENCNAFDGFHVYGHLDYIIRYAPIKPEEKTVDSYGDYTDVLDECLKTILSHDRGIEVNSAGFKYGLGHPHPSPNLLKRYRELGGELITIGSDAHEPKHLCYDFDRVADLLKEIGFRYYAVFVQGKPEYEKL